MKPDPNREILVINMNIEGNRCLANRHYTENALFANDNDVIMKVLDWGFTHVWVECVSARKSGNKASFTHEDFLSMYTKVEDK